jgi:hypothetical protein
MNMFEEMEMNYWLPEAQKILAEIQKEDQQNGR